MESESLNEGDEMEFATTVLAEHGILPSERGWREEDLGATITERGWTYAIGNDPERPEQAVATIQHDGEESRASSPDRVVAPRAALATAVKDTAGSTTA